MKFFRDIPNKLFLKAKQAWSYYDDKNDMIKLIDCLVEKGTKERKLKYNLKKTFERRMNFVVKNDTHVENECYDELYDIKNCYEILKRIEDKFSEYLSLYEKQWETKENRNKWVTYYNNRMIIYQKHLILKIL